MRIIRFVSLTMFCVFILSLTFTASAQQGAPVLETVEDASSGTARLTWTNGSDLPAQFLGFAWDLYTEDWVERGINDSMWYDIDYNRSSASYVGDMNLGHSGAYFTWISNHYSDGSWFPCDNPATFQFLSSTPHKPFDVEAVQTEDNTVRLSWKPEPFGTWLYWIIAYDFYNAEWVTTQGPQGESIWHYVEYGTEEFTDGTTTLTLSSRGTYVFYTAAMAWDAETWSEFETAFTFVAPTETIMLPGDVPLEMVRIAAGSFQMGSPDTERSRSYTEGPVHTVSIASDFYMGKYEVTQAQWLAVMSSWPGASPSFYHGVGDDYPAYYVSRNDILGPGGFIEKLNQHITSTGQGPATYRLPSEAKWEYSCRAGTQSRFFFGDSLSVDDNDTNGPAETLPGNRSDYMWFSGNNIPFGSKEVGMKIPNQFGLYDMHGNVWECCEDWWHSSYSGAPTDGSSWILPTDSTWVTRGGSWFTGANNLRSAKRLNPNPHSRFTDLGFRLSRTID